MSAVRTRPSYRRQPTPTHHHPMTVRRRSSALVLPSLVPSLVPVLVPVLVPSLVAALVLLQPVAAARPGFKPSAPDTEGRQPASLLVTVPASVLLPSLVAATADRAARALNSGPLLPHDDIPIDLNHLAMEERLQRFFSYFELPPGPCQERLVCEVTSDPARFDPMTGVFLRALVPADRLPAATDPGAADSLDVDGEDVLTRLERLQLAAGKAGNCADRYSGCPIRPEELISQTALELWRWSTALTNVEFTTVEL